jgi:threonine dehydrogenase-like Zn-dependent dehydrogenase
VAIEPNIPCHFCEPCSTGRYNVSDHVLFLSTPPVPGLLRRYVTHPANWCHKLPPNMTHEYGALLEPPSVSLAAVDRSKLRLGDLAIICGGGSISLITYLCAKAAGAEPILITDINRGLLKFAQTLVANSLGYSTHIPSIAGEIQIGISGRNEGSIGGGTGRCPRMHRHRRFRRCKHSCGPLWWTSCSRRWRRGERDEAPAHETKHPRG